MNSHEAYIIILSFIHMAIWLFAFVGGLYSPKLAVLIITLYLPALYCFQSMPLHVLTKHKLEYILKYKSFLQWEEREHTDKEMCDYTIWAKKMNLPLEDVVDAMDCIEHYLECTVLSKIITFVRGVFRDSWMNPLSPQGMLIFAFIINSLLLKYKYNMI